MRRESYIMMKTHDGKRQHKEPEVDKLQVETPYIEIAQNETYGLKDYDGIKLKHENANLDESTLSQSPDNIEIWEDLVNIKDLVKALLICIITTFAGHFLAPNDSYKPLLFGLVGAIVGFLISSFIIEPKRKFIQED